MSLLGVIGALLPLGVAAALSSVPIAVVVVLLLSPRSSPNGVGYSIGQFSGVFILTIGLSSGLASIPAPLPIARQVMFGVAELVVGVVLVLYGSLRVSNPREASRAGLHGWIRRLAAVRVWTALGLGVALNLRPKGVLLAIAAGIAVGSEHLPPSATLVAVAFYAALSTSVVAGAVIAHLARPSATRRWLERARGWLDTHGRLITLVVTVVIGFVILGNGLVRINR